MTAKELPDDDQLTIEHLPRLACPICRRDDYWIATPISQTDRCDYSCLACGHDNTLIRAHGRWSFITTMMVAA